MGGIAAADGEEHNRAMGRSIVYLCSLLMMFGLACATPLRSQIASAKASSVAIRLLVETRTADGVQRTSLLAGSGVAIASDRVVTCAHVLNAKGKRLVQIQVLRDVDWREERGAWRVIAHAATLEWRDQEKDLAVLEVPGLNAIAARVSDQPLAPGDDAFWLGHPFGGGPSVSAGIVSDVTVFGGGGSGYRLDGTVNAGNSGGGVFSRENGRLVGIINAREGALSEELRRFRDAPGSSGPAGGTEETLVVRQTLRELGNDLQLGIGYAIGIAELPPSERGERPQPKVARLDPHLDPAWRMILPWRYR